MKDTTLLTHILKELSEYEQHCENGTLEEYRSEKGNLEFVMELLARSHKEFIAREEVDKHAA